MANVQLDAGTYRQTRLPRSPARRRGGWVGAFALILAEAVFAIGLVIVGVTIFAKLKVASQNASMDLRAAGPMVPRLPDRGPTRAGPVEAPVAAPIPDPAPETAVSTPVASPPAPPPVLSMAAEADSAATSGATALLTAAMEAASPPIIDFAKVAPVETPATPDPLPVARSEIPPPADRSEALPAVEQSETLLPTPPAAAPVAESPDPISEFIRRDAATAPDQPVPVTAAAPRPDRTASIRSPTPNGERSTVRSTTAKKRPPRTHRAAKTPKPRPHVAAKRARPRQARSPAPASSPSTYSGILRTTGTTPSATRYMLDR